MSVFLTPDLQPFMGATYFPPEDKFGRPGFKTILTRIAQIWAASPEKLKQAGKSTVAQLKAYVEVGDDDGCLCFYLEFNMGLTRHIVETPWIILGKCIDTLEHG